MVEGARLERVYGCKPIEGSNPSLSASSTDFLCESPYNLQTSAPWRFGVALKTTSLFRQIVVRGAEWFLERLGNRDQPGANRPSEMPLDHAWPLQVPPRKRQSQGHYKQR